MAGELPGAGDARRKKQTQASKRPLRWQDDKSTDKIYKSVNISALDQSRTVADSTLKPGEEPVATPTPRQKADDKSADKYYANGGSDRVRGTAQAKKERAGMKPPAATPQLGVKKAPAAEPKKSLKSALGLHVHTKDDVQGVLNNVVDQLQGGNTQVVVYVKQGDSSLLRRVRAGLDLLVTRETITEDQYRDVRLSYELAAGEQAGVAEKLGVPEAKGTEAVSTDAKAADVDPLAFLNGEGDDPDDPVVDTSPIRPEEAVTVDTTNDPAESKAVEDDDDDDNDFLKPKAEPPATDTILTTVPVQDAVFTPDAAEVSPEGFPPTQEETAKAEELPRRRGKRSGRGAD